MITRLAIAGYRSLRDVRLRLDAINVVTGPNGSGKSSLYRALRLLANIAQGRIVQSLAAEGGLSSTLWAGPEIISPAIKQARVPVQGTVRKHPVSLRLGFSSDEYGYAIDLGLPIPRASMFTMDPEIKVESLWTGPTLGRANEFARRQGPSVRIRDAAGNWRSVSLQLAPFDSMVAQCSDPREAPELLLLRERLQAWRFYDHLAPIPMLRRAGATSGPTRRYSPAMVPTLRQPCKRFWRAATGPRSTMRSPMPSPGRGWR